MARTCNTPTMERTALPKLATASTTRSYTRSMRWVIELRKKPTIRVTPWPEPGSRSMTVSTGFIRAWGRNEPQQQQTDQEPSCAAWPGTGFLRVRRPRPGGQRLRSVLPGCHHLLHEQLLVTLLQRGNLLVGDAIYRIDRGDG